jgi:hypothetical protein
MSCIKNRLSVLFFCLAFTASVSGCSNAPQAGANTAIPIAAVSSAPSSPAHDAAAATQSVQIQTTAIPQSSTPAQTQAEQIPAEDPTASICPAVWPGDIPGDIPQFQHGKCLECERSIQDETGLTLIHLGFSAVSTKDINEYAKLLKSKGYIVSEDKTKENVVLSGIKMKDDQVVIFIMVNLQLDTNICSCDMTYQA